MQAMFCKVSIVPISQFKKVQFESEDSNSNACKSVDFRKMMRKYLKIVRRGGGERACCDLSDFLKREKKY